MNDEMNLKAFGTNTVKPTTPRNKVQPATSEKSDEEKDILNSLSLVQWAVCGPHTYKPVSSTATKLTSGVYSVAVSQYHGIIYQKKNVCVDDLLRFPDSISEKILSEITAFWGKGSKFQEHGFLHRRGYLLHGPAGCHAKGTKVMMFDGSFKNVEDIKFGDILMGPDSKHRFVYETLGGNEEMFRITPNKGNPFIVNKNHILHLTPSCKNDTFKFPLNIKVSDYLSLSECTKERFKLTYVNGIDFDLFKDEKLSIPPYILGLWLGDGTARDPSITSIDDEIITEWNEYGKEINVFVRKNDIVHTFTQGKLGHRGNPNPFELLLKDLNLSNNKHIPKKYLHSSKKQRLELIAGLLDTDGYYKKGCYNFTNKNEQIVDSMLYLCKSVGLAAYKTTSTKGCWYKNKYREGIYHNISISGFVEMIPCKIARKVPSKRKQIKDVLRTGFKIESIGSGDYYGFNLSHDHLYLTSDFMIHHNSGKTCLVQQIIADIVNADGLVFQCTNHPAVFNDGLAQFRKVEPDRPIVCLFEDIDAIVAEHGEDEILQLLDGESAIDKCLNIATTNYPENLDKRLVARPRRFDRVIQIGMPSPEVRKLYFQKKLNVTDVEIENWVKASDGFSFAACAELVISVCCFEKPFENAVKDLKEMMSANVSSRDYDKSQTLGFSQRT
jgi:hypothetical protein